MKLFCDTPEHQLYRYTCFIRLVYVSLHKVKGRGMLDSQYKQSDVNILTFKYDSMNTLRAIASNGQIFCTL